MFSNFERSKDAQVGEQIEFQQERAGGLAEAWLATAAQKESTERGRSYGRYF